MEEINKFNDWMLKIGNIHYSNHASMMTAYEIISTPIN